MQIKKDWRYDLQSVAQKSFKDTIHGLGPSFVSTVYITNKYLSNFEFYHLCGPVVRVPGYRSRGPDSIPGGTRFSE
jgi:hypothetical protein